MKTLCIDIGNTQIKTALFIDTSMRETVKFNTFDELSEHIKNFEGKIIVSSTRNLPEALTNNQHLTFLTHMSKLPFINEYESPKTLGLDRIANISGATIKLPGDPKLIIDMGTCITYDLLNEKNEYEGGMISPGIQIRFKAMHTFTDKLPLIQAFQDDEEIIGKNTEKSMVKGVYKGVNAEISGIIATYQKKYEGLKVLLTGGDAPSFENQLNHPIFATPELTLAGLYEISKLN